MDFDAVEFSQHLKKSHTVLGTTRSGDADNETLFLFHRHPLVLGNHKCRTLADVERVMLAARGAISPDGRKISVP